MNTTSPIHVGAVLFEGFELLDFYGPLEMFGLLDSAVRFTIMAEKAGTVRSSHGPCGVAEATMAGSGGFDVLLIPGGIGTRKEIANPPFLAELKRLAEASGLVATVCTGSLLLAKTGLLDGRKATSNKRVFQLVASSRAEGELDCEGALGGGREIFYGVGRQRRNGHGPGRDRQILWPGKESGACPPGRIRVA